MKHIFERLLLCDANGITKNNLKNTSLLLVVSARTDHFLLKTYNGSIRLLTREQAVYNTSWRKRMQHYQDGTYFYCPFSYLLELYMNM